MAVVAKPCHSITSHARTWQTTPSPIHSHRTKVHPKLPALIRPRAYTSLVPNHAQRRPDGPCPAIACRNPTKSIPHLPRRSGTVPARVWFDTKTQHAFPHTDSPYTDSPERIPLRPRRSASVPTRWWLINGTGPNRTDLTPTQRATTHPTLRHRSRDHADRVGGVQAPTKQSKTCLDQTQPDAT
jgi:hypothetical protein